jgi:hypothetical protein
MPFSDASTYHILWSDVVLVESGAIGQSLAPVAEAEKPARKPAAKSAAKTTAKKTPAAKKTAAKKTPAKKEK